MFSNTGGPGPGNGTIAKSSYAGNTTKYVILIFRKAVFRKKKHKKMYYIEKFVLFKVSFFGQCSKMQLIPFKNFIIKTCFIHFFWFFGLKY